MSEHVVLKSVKRDLKLATSSSIKAGMDGVTVDANHLQWLIEQAEMFESLAEHHDEALAENKRLLEALEFYADAQKWTKQHIKDNSWTVPKILRDNGNVAARALEGIK